MRRRQTKTKSKAVCTAVEETSPLAQSKPTVHLRDLLGAAKRLPQRPRKNWLKKENLWDLNGRCDRPLLILPRKKSRP